MRPFTLHVHPGYFDRTPIADGRPRQISQVIEIPRFDPKKPVPFPPVTMAEQEFWARRDRQQFCRDVFVLLYTLAGTQRNPASQLRIADYARLPNDPAAAEGWIDPSGASGFLPVYRRSTARNGAVRRQFGGCHGHRQHRH
jgi:hypothetical protein